MASSQILKKRTCTSKGCNHRLDLRANMCAANRLMASGLVVLLDRRLWSWCAIKVWFPCMDSFGWKDVLSLTGSGTAQQSGKGVVHMWATQSSNCRVRTQHILMTSTLKTYVSGKVLVTSGTPFPSFCARGGCHQSVIPYIYIYIYKYVQ